MIAKPQESGYEPDDGSSPTAIGLAWRGHRVAIPTHGPVVVPDGVPPLPVVLLARVPRRRGTIASDACERRRGRPRDGSLTTRTATGVMSRVNTSNAGDVITGPVGEGIGANDAHELAGITYRQLDHWARQGWVLPSLDPGKGRSGRRLYSRSDVVRLDLLRHLAISKVNTAHAGPRVSELKLSEADMVVLWGPVGGKADLVVVARAAALSSLTAGGAWVVYDPNPIRRRLPRVSADADPGAHSANALPAGRRSA